MMEAQSSLTNDHVSGWFHQEGRKGRLLQEKLISKENHCGVNLLESGSMMDMRILLEGSQKEGQAHIGGS